MKIEEYVVDLFWDVDRAIWTATSKAVQGLSMSSASFDALMEEIQKSVSRFAAAGDHPPSTRFRYRFGVCRSIAGKEESW